MNTNRQDSTLDIFKYADKSLVLPAYDMNTGMFNAVTAEFNTDPSFIHTQDQTYTLVQESNDKLQPDIAIIVEDQFLMSTRGPKPVSVVKDVNMRANARPGLMGFTIDRANSCKPAADPKAFALTVWE